MAQSKKIFEINPIGRIVRDENEEKVYVEVDEQYRPAMLHMEEFSHLQVYWWADKTSSKKYRKTLQADPPYDAPRLGMFACRSPVRPNPIAMTTVKMLDVDQETGVVEIGDIDAFDGTPVLDLKVYVPVCDRVQRPKVPDYCADWPKWYPDEGWGPENY